MAKSTSKSKSLAMRFSIALGIEIIVLMALLGALIALVMRTNLQKSFITSTSELLDAHVQGLAYRNSKFMQQLRMYTMADVIQAGSTTEDIVEWLHAHKKIRSGDFQSLMYCDLATGMAYTDDGKEFSVADTQYFKAMAGDKS